MHTGVIDEMSLRRFAAVAATPIILNICLILSLEILQYWTETPGHALAIGVSIAGVIQLLWLVAACERAGFSLRLTFPKFTPKLRKGSPKRERCMVRTLAATKKMMANGINQKA